MTAPDYIFPVVGYRVWQWDATGLKSLNGIAWHPGEAFTAECKTQGCHEVPRADCTCGIYASKSLDHLRRIGYTEDRIHGEVCLWGTVVEHEGGWRAQFAYPRTSSCRFHLCPLTWAGRIVACHIGGVPLRHLPPWRNRNSAAVAHGLRRRCGRAWPAGAAMQWLVCPASRATADQTGRPCGCLRAWNCGGRACRQQSGAGCPWWQKRAEDRAQGSRLGRAKHAVGNGSRRSHKIDGAQAAA